MARPIIKIVNATTGEEIEREMDDKEFAEYEKRQEEVALDAAHLAQKAKNRQYILDRLGLTEEEVKLLIG